MQESVLMPRVYHLLWLLLRVLLARLLRQWLRELVAHTLTRSVPLPRVVDCQESTGREFAWNWLRVRLQLPELHLRSQSGARRTGQPTVDVAHGMEAKFVKPVHLSAPTRDGARRAALETPSSTTRKDATRHKGADRNGVASDND